MLFRRRKKPTIAERLRAFFWPRKGLTRPARYIVRRIQRLSASPHQVAAGVAAGTFSAFSPFLGFHMLMALALAYLLAGNLLAAVLSTAIANPLTMPLIAFLTFRMGEAAIGTGGGTVLSSDDLFHMLEHLEFTALWHPVLKPMIIGSGVVGLPAAVAAYCGTRYAVRVVRRRRSERLVARAGLAEPQMFTSGDAPL